MPTTISPVVHFRDLAAGAQFLVEAFGFEEREASKGPDGELVYVELALDGASLGVGSTEEGSMFDLGPTGVYVALDEVDTMHARAVASGAEILMPPTDQDYGSRDFVAKDPEGNLWCFGTYRPGG